MYVQMYQSIISCYNCPTYFHSSDTAPDAVFAGSMQLLAGVKLCTGRTITNHPHFENKLLRERTVQV